MKRGQIWISAVIYIGLGVIAITLLVGAGVPLINKVRDRNTFLQTKDVMQTIDKAIMQVVAEGPGSQRVLSPLEIKRGFLSIPISREIKWEMETKAVLQEPGQLIREGNLNLLLMEDELIVDLYDAKIFLNHYSDDLIYICVNGDCSGEINNLNGKFGLSIINEGAGVFEGSEFIRHKINIEVL